jgi:hypothetical protein
MVESCLIVHDNQEYAKKLKSYVKKNENWRERKLEGKWKILDLKFCYEQKQLGFGFYMVH